MSEVTAIEHLIASQRRWSPKATGQFTALMHDLILSAKIISRNVNQAGLVDILGATGSMNVQGEQVQKLDIFANNTLVYRMQSSGSVCAVGSEEMAEPFFVPENEPHGHYVIFFDPLDGSSNIDVGVSIGTIFSIYRRSDDENYWELNSDALLRPGLELGEIKKDRFQPAHALALWLKDGVQRFRLPADSNEIKAYLHGEALPCTTKGWQVVCVDDYSIGWGKGDGNWLKNHYPKGLRR